MLRLYYTIFFLFVAYLATLQLNFFAGQLATAKAGPSVPDIFDFFSQERFLLLREYAAMVHLFWSPFLLPPLYLYMLFVYPIKLVHFLVLKIVLVALRMLTINMTWLGKVENQPAISGYDFTFGGDLFFSGHVAYSFLLYLIMRDTPLRHYILAFHVLVTLAAIVGRFHYAIDVVGAYAIAYAVYKLTEPLCQKWLARYSAPTGPVQAKTV